MQGAEWEVRGAGLPVGGAQVGEVTLGHGWCLGGAWVVLDGP